MQRRRPGHREQCLAKGKWKTTTVHNKCNANSTGWREPKHDVGRLVMNMDEEEHVVVSETCVLVMSCIGRGKKDGTFIDEGH